MLPEGVTPTSQLKKEKLKKEGRYMTKAQAKKAAIARAQLEKMGAVPSGQWLIEVCVFLFVV